MLRILRRFVSQQKAMIILMYRFIKSEIHVRRMRRSFKVLTDIGLWNELIGHKQGGLA